MGEGERQDATETDRAATERPTIHVRRRLTVSEAADELGISAEAVRSRVKRGTLRSAKEGGTVYVLLPSAQTRPGDDQARTGSDQTTDQDTPEHDRSGDRTGDQAALVESLLEQLAYMREQLAEEREARRRADTIMAQLSQANAEQARTIRALEPSSNPEPPDAPETASPRPDRGAHPRILRSLLRAALGVGGEGSLTSMIGGADRWWRRICG